jgi:predicted ATP-dependent serine protease
LKATTDDCQECGAIKFRWMGEHHECMPLTTIDGYEHPYAFFFEPLDWDDEDWGYW